MLKRNRGSQDVYFIVDQCSLSMAAKNPLDSLRAEAQAFRISVGIQILTAVPSKMVNERKFLTPLSTQPNLPITHYYYSYYKPYNFH